MIHNHEVESSSLSLATIKINKLRHSVSLVDFFICTQIRQSRHLRNYFTGNDIREEKLRPPLRRGIPNAFFHPQAHRKAPPPKISIRKFPSVQQVSIPPPHRKPIRRRHEKPVRDGFPTHRRGTRHARAVRLRTCSNLKNTDIPEPRRARLPPSYGGQSFTPSAVSAASKRSPSSPTDLTSRRPSRPMR